MTNRSEMTINFSIHLKNERKKNYGFVFRWQRPMMINTCWFPVRRGFRTQARSSGACLWISHFSRNPLRHRETSFQIVVGASIVDFPTPFLEWLKTVSFKTQLPKFYLSLPIPCVLVWLIGIVNVQLKDPLFPLFHTTYSQSTCIVWKQNGTTIEPSYFVEWKKNKFFFSSFQSYTALVHQQHYAVRLASNGMSLLWIKQTWFQSRF